MPKRRGSLYFFRPIAGVMFGLAMLPAQASLNVFACQPALAELVKALVPDAQVQTATTTGQIHTATTAWQDPLYIEAQPILIAAMHRADVAVCTGTSREAVWLSALIRRASNQNIQPGKPGLFLVTDDVPSNRHLDPDRLPDVMDALSDRLVEVAPEQLNAIRQHQRQWQVRWKLNAARSPSKYSGFAMAPN